MGEVHVGCCRGVHVYFHGYLFHLSTAVAVVLVLDSSAGDGHCCGSHCDYEHHFDSHSESHSDHSHSFLDGCIHCHSHNFQPHPPCCSPDHCPHCPGSCLVQTPTPPTVGAIVHCSPMALHSWHCSPHSHCSQCCPHSPTFFSATPIPSSPLFPTDAKTPCGGLPSTV